MVVSRSLINPGTICLFQHCISNTERTGRYPRNGLTFMSSRHWLLRTPMFETWLWCQKPLPTVSLSAWKHLALQKDHRCTCSMISNTILILVVVPKQKMRGPNISRPRKPSLSDLLYNYVSRQLLIRVWTERKSFPQRHQGRMQCPDANLSMPHFHILLLLDSLGQNQ